MDSYCIEEITVTCVEDTQALHHTFKPASMSVAVCQRRAVEQAAMDVLQPTRSVRIPSVAPWPWARLQHDQITYLMTTAFELAGARFQIHCCRTVGDPACFSAFGSRLPAETMINPPTAAVWGGGMPKVYGVCLLPKGFVVTSGSSP